MQPLIKPVDKDLIINELEGKLLCKTQKANNEIYIVNAHNSPNVIREIGRLRELSFRCSGGGSGNSYDLDDFDFLEKPFEQLIVFNPLKQEVIGGYRFLHGKNASFNQKGEPVMPMGHIFNFSKQYITDYMPFSIELGRAFIQPKYQSIKMGLKSLYSLDNLWDGLGEMINTYDDVRYLVGKVTIYPQMQIEARYAIIFFLKHFFPDKNNLFVPIKEEIVPNNFCNFFKKKLFTEKTIKENFRILIKYLKERNETIPPLIKAYIELSTTMKSFGTCFDTDFGNIYDTGIMITIDDIYDDKKERYLSRYIQKHSAIDIIFNLNKRI